MNSVGETQPEIYHLARSAMLDALEALGVHRDALIIVGAQAVYLHVGEAPDPVEPFTTDGDLALDPLELRTTPTLEELMQAGGFVKHEREVGRWVHPSGIFVDLLVPEQLGGPGRRGARLKGHGTVAARKARGLEAAVVDYSVMEVGSLSSTDRRSFRTKVAGPAALLVAKAHKIQERVGAKNRERSKDAYDVYRLLRGFETTILAERFRLLLADKKAAQVTDEAIRFLKELFVDAGSPGIDLIRDHVGDGALADPEFVAGACRDLITRLLLNLGRSILRKSSRGDR